MHWLMKLLLTVAVIGFLAYDGVSIFVSSVSTSDKANTLASEAADSVHSTRNIQTSYQAIEAEAKADGYTIRPADFKVDTNGEVTLVLRKTAHSLWMNRIGQFKHYLDIVETGSGAPPS